MKVQKERRDLLRTANRSTIWTGNTRSSCVCYEAYEQHREPDAVACAGCASESDEDRADRILPGDDAGGTTAEKVYEILAEKAPDTESADVHIISQEQSTVYLAVICLREEAGAVEDALRSEGFARPSQSWDEAPARRKRYWSRRSRSVRIT